MGMERQNTYVHMFYKNKNNKQFQEARCTSTGSNAQF